MANPTLNLIEAAGKCGDQDLLRVLAETVLKQLMEFEVSKMINAERSEQTGGRSAYRNGYRERTLDTRLGTLELDIPKLRSGPSYFPSFLEPRRLSERALAAVIQQAWVGGVSTRKMDHLVKAMGCEGISKSQVSELCQALDTRVNDFLQRKLDGEWPFVYLDATYLKVRQGGQVISVAAIIATGVKHDGTREILGLGVGLSEAKEYWVGFLNQLVARGLQGVKLVMSDSHTGLKAAIAQVLGASWQRCRVHFTRNLLARVPKAACGMVTALLQPVFRCGDQAEARQSWRRVADELRKRYPRAAELMDEAEDDVLAFMVFPVILRSELHSTNPLERLNKEVKRRSNVVGIFPNETSIVRLVGAVLMEQNDDWLQASRYMSLTAMNAVRGVAETPAAVLAA